MKKIKIAFDLDGIIIDKPPFVPKKLLERLFRGGGKNGLYYRFPKAKFEQWIRKISHYYLFRPPINKNITFIKKIAKERNYELYIVSSRYSFLKKETENWLKKKELTGLFKKVFLNLNDAQPHLFKESVLKELKPDIFIDDDSLIADYLNNRLPTIRIYYYSKEGNLHLKQDFLDSLDSLKLE